MATQFQNRLIGTVILVSLGVILLPDLLMGQKNDIAAPAGSIPLRPEQSLVAPQTTTIIPNTNANPSAAVDTHSAVTASNSAPVTPIKSTNGVSVTQSGAVIQNENWQVEEVAAPVTISESKSENTIVTTKVINEKAQAAELAKAKARELESKKKEQLLIATKAKEAAKARELIALEKQKAAEDIAPQMAAPSIAETKPAETAVITPEVTVKKDESGLVIKTPAQVEAERAASKSVASSTHPSAPKTVSSVAHNGSWIIQVGVFSNAENAQALATKLRSAGYGASAQRAGQLTRVMIGPDVSKEKLQAMLGNINRVGGTSARVITYSAAGN